MPDDNINFQHRIPAVCFEEFSVLGISWLPMIEFVHEAVSPDSIASNTHILPKAKQRFRGLTK